MNRRVVVVGMGAVSPLGLDYESMWKALLAGESGVDRIASFDASTLPCQIAAEIKGFNPAQMIGKTKLTKYMTRSVQLLVCASNMAVEDAGVQMENVDPNEVGIAIGSSTNPIPVEELSYFYRFARGGDWDYRQLGSRASWDIKFLFKNMTNMSSCILSIVYGLHGPNMTTHTACASGAQAIGEGFRIIQRGDAEMMICGGSDAIIDPMGIAGFMLLGVLSKNNTEPKKASRPFDRKRDGFVLGEGAGVLVLEELSHALNRKAPIHAELIGYGSSSNAYRITDIHGDCDGAVLAIEACLRDADVTRQDIDYINAHGTSTIQNDRTETTAIKRVFGDYAYELPMSSMKSMMGHAISAAGSLELIATILAIEQNMIPPTINYEFPDPKCDLDYVPNRARKADVDVALSNSFAFGGQNASLLVRRY